MPRRKEILGVPKSNILVDVVMHKSNLNESSYGTIECRKVNITDIINKLGDNHHLAVAKEIAKYIADMFESQLLKELQSGHAVELFGLGTIYPCIKGEVKKTDRPKELEKRLTTGFTPSKKANEAVKSLNVRSVKEAVKQHFIACVKDKCEAYKLNTIGKNNLAVIKGKAIKLSSDLEGLYAVKYSSIYSNDYIPSRKDWIKIEHVIQTSQSEIEFVAEELDVGSYQFIVECAYSAGGKELKTKVPIISEAVNITGTACIETGNA